MHVKPKAEPILNVPPVVVALLGAMAIVHVGRQLALSHDEDIEFLLTFAFIPARYETTLLPPGSFPGGWGAQVWTFVTYAFIHADIMHITINSVWFLAFGSAVARRFGTARFLAFFAVTAAAGAVAHLVTHLGELFPVVGASAAISGFMAAAIRFVFQAGGPLGLWRTRDAEAYRVAAAPLSAALRDPRILVFLLVWFGLNLLVGIGTVSVPGVEQATAWQAHIGGFVAGLVLFAFFDPKRAPADAGDGDGQGSRPTLH